MELTSDYYHCIIKKLEECSFILVLPITFKNSANTSLIS